MTALFKTIRMMFEIVIILLFASTSMACLRLSSECKIIDNIDPCCPKSYCYQEEGWPHGYCKPPETF